MITTEFKNKGKEVKATDSLGELVRIPAGVFEKLGVNQSYKVVNHSLNGSFTSEKGITYKFVNAVLNEKGLVTYLVNANDVVEPNGEVILTYNGLSDAGYAQFNVISEIPKA